MVQNVNQNPHSLNSLAAAELRGYLGRASLTTGRAAELIGVQRQWLGRRLTGAIPLTLEDLELICSGLDLKVSDVFRVPAGAEAVA